MVIEWLKIQVAPEQREYYVQKDAEIWTPFLSQYSGFLGKEVWIHPTKTDEVVLIIRWDSKEAWKSIPAEALKAVEQQFDRSLGVPYKMVEEGEYQLRKFPEGGH